jgi:hypothetical protein
MAKRNNTLHEEEEYVFCTTCMADASVPVSEISTDRCPMDVLAKRSTVVLQHST